MPVRLALMTNYLVGPAFIYWCVCDAALASAVFFGG